jgi:hypothetical protein
MMGVMHGMFHGKHVLGSALWGPKCVKKGKVVQNEELIGAYILMKQILNFYDPIFFKTTLDY